MTGSLRLCYNDGSPESAKIPSSYETRKSGPSLRATLVYVKQNRALGLVTVTEPLTLCPPP